MNDKVQVALSLGEVRAVARALQVARLHHFRCGVGRGRQSHIYDCAAGASAVLRIALCNYAEGRQCGSFGAGDKLRCKWEAEGYRDMGVRYA